MQRILGLIWLVDGGLQLQSFMYSRDFVATLSANAAGQPTWLSTSILWGAHLAQSQLTLFDSVFPAVQVLIGLGLLYRPTVRLAIAGSCVWALIVWWFGEGLGMMLTGMASPLTGAPGAVILYPLVGLLLWPNERPGGLLGARGARTAWTVLWLVMAWLWLMAPSSNPGAIAQAIGSAPAGMGWLAAIQHWAAEATRGVGVPLAFALAAASGAIALGIRTARPRPYLAAAVALNLAYWVLGQGLGGILTGQATDPNAGPLFVLLAVVLWRMELGVESLSLTTSSRAADEQGGDCAVPAGERRPCPQRPAAAAVRWLHMRQSGRARRPAAVAEPAGWSPPVG
jgi:hypothetical protein